MAHAPLLHGRAPQSAGGWSCDLSPRLLPGEWPGTSVSSTVGTGGLPTGNRDGRRQAGWHFYGFPTLSMVRKHLCADCFSDAVLNTDSRQSRRVTWDGEENSALAPRRSENSGEKSLVSNIRSGHLH